MLDRYRYCLRHVEEAQLIRVLRGSNNTGRSKSASKRTKQPVCAMDSPNEISDSVFLEELLSQVLEISLRERHIGSDSNLRFLV